MDYSLEKSRTGLSTLKVDGYYIYSRYDPIKEIKVFYQTLKKEWLHQKIRSFIIIGDDLGYLINFIQQDYPSSRIILLPIRNNSGTLHSAIETYKENQDIYSFLSEKFNNELSLIGLKVITLPSIARLTIDKMTMYQQALYKKLTSLKLLFTTTATFSWIWLRNLIDNYSQIEKYYRFSLDKEKNSSVLILASGPSLNQEIDKVKEIQENYNVQLWALPSSLKALKHYGIKPDLTIYIDPGFLNRYLLIDHPKEKPIITSLISHRLRELKETPIILFNQNNLWEESFFKYNSHINHYLTIQEQPTVAASAIEIALKIGFSQIALLGQDFAYFDIQGHAKPHHSQFLKKENRLMPSYSQSFKNMLLSTNKIINKDYPLWRTGEVLNIYANYISNRTLLKDKNKITNVSLSPLKIEGIKNQSLTNWLTNQEKQEKKPIELILIQNQLKEQRKDELLLFLKGLEKEFSNNENLIYYLTPIDYKLSLEGKISLEEVKKRAHSKLQDIMNYKN